MKTRNTGGRALAAFAAAALTVGLVAAPSEAKRTTVEETAIDWKPLFYDDVVTGDGVNTLILYTGATAEELCTGAIETTLGTTRTKGEPPEEGARSVERLVTRAPFYVYEGNGLDAVEFWDAVCQELESGGDAPEPLATGAGLVKQRIISHFNGAEEPPDVRIVNSAVGNVRTTEGQRWAVRGEAELTVSPDFVVEHVAFIIRNQR